MDSGSEVSDYDMGESDNYCSENDEMDVVAEKAEKKPAYDILTTEEGKQMKKCLVEKVVALSQLSPSVAKILLFHFKWDASIVLENLWKDQKALFEKTGIVVSHASTSRRGRSRKMEVSCEICLESYGICELHGIGCEHKFCIHCWKGHLESKINDGETYSITCPGMKCTRKVSEDYMSEFIRDPEMIAKYHNIDFNFFVLANKNLAWCVGPNCDKIIRVVEFGAQEIECSCLFRFCFECKEPWHDPVDCTLLREWNKKGRKDSATSHWIALNTKECPKCHTSINKNGGCNHMTCRAPHCTFEFCWICRGPWKDHTGNYNCTKFNANPSESDRQMRLRRFVHFDDRFNAHCRSLKLEEKLRETTQENVVELQKMGCGSYADISNCLLGAVDALLKCRQTLMYTYVFRYYVKDSIQSAIFEGNQEDLQSIVEKLSGELEKKLPEAIQGNKNEFNFNEFKIKLSDLKSYCNTRRVVLSTHVREGYDNLTWDFDESLFV